jgi:hypothetical protein
MTRERERNYGLYVVGQLILGVIGVKFLPALIASYGLIALYGTLAACALALLPTVRWLPSSGLAPRHSGQSTARVERLQRMPASRIDRRALMGLGAILCFYVALSAVWAYLERIGAHAGFRRETIADVLALASVCGVAGSVAAIALGGRCGRGLPICAGYTLLISSIASLFYVGASVPAYALGACAFKFAWTFALPFVLATLASRDQTGSIIVAANLLIIVGLASGPALAALSLQRAPDYSGTLMIGVVLAALSLILILPAAFGRYEPQVANAPAS